MNHGYDCRTVVMDFYAPRDQFVVELQTLGDEGWEPFEIQGDFLSSARQIALRRPEQTSLRNPWEIRMFPVVDMPDPEWPHHLMSCGWMLLPPVPSNTLDPFYLARRGFEWRGADDGDILGRLLDVGYPAYHERRRVIRNILKTKWILSEQLGSNAGTWAAVKRWLGDEVLPKMLAARGFVLQNGDPDACSKKCWS